MSSSPTARRSSPERPDRENDAPRRAGLCAGARAGADVVRRGARKALVTLAFEPDDALRARLAADGFELDRGEQGTIAREMTDSGRSTLRVNGRASTAAYVREIRDAIAEIVGQHEAQRLLSAGYHLELLDRFAGEAALRLRAEVAAAYARAEESAQTLARLMQDERRARERYDDACFAVREIEEARLESSEIEPLAQRRAYLDNVERIAVALHAAREALAAEEGAQPAPWELRPSRSLALENSMLRCTRPRNAHRRCKPMP